jgi:catechol 2,3-dioxygenase-like lactoylglutathione lyase family enzyme/predicted kinase
MEQPPMPPTPLIIVSGPPASGKTALARRLAADLRLPLLSRDDFKERLFDTLGTTWPTATAEPNRDTTDRAWSRRLGAASYELLWGALEIHLAAGVATIVESNFPGGRASARFQALAARHPFVARQVNCVADGATLLRRHRERAASGERHPGHGDDLDDALHAVFRRGRLDPLDLPGATIEVDTTDFAMLPYDGLLTNLRAWLATPEDGDTPPTPRVMALDHLVLTVRDLAATRDWYATVLGMGVVAFAPGRWGLTFGRQKINLHEAGHEFEPKAIRPTPGSGDLCFLTAIPLDVYQRHLAALGVPIELGPVDRSGARGALRSLYLRDPDDNLIEISNAVSAGGADDDTRLPIHLAGQP